MFLSGDKVIYSFNPQMEENYRVKAGDVFTVETHDCFYQQFLNEDFGLKDLDMGRINPATGPIFVEGAKVGDVLKVEILDIEVADRGVAAIIPGMGFLAETNTEETIQVIPVEEGYAKFLDLNLPIKPMIGVIGVAPREGDIPTDTPGAHGGNLDTKEIVAGSTLYFPVAKEGALLALGDCHGLMGDGELGVTGLEIAAQVRLKVDVIKDKKLDWPLLETQEDIMLLVSDSDIKKALELGYGETRKLIERSLNCSWNEAGILTSLAVDARISQLVNPLVTVRYPISKKILPVDRVLEKL